MDLWSAGRVATAIVAGQREALVAVEPAIPALAAATEALADKLSSGGRMAYAGAGSSGLIAQMDALELPGTFGISADRVPVILAGGAGALAAIPADTEDDEAAAEAEVERLGLGPADALIAVAASGSTLFTVAALRCAKMRGTLTIGIACVAGSRLLTESDHPILLDVPAEVVAGSTRMGAGTAQKCALNVLSTGVGVRLGHAYRGMMVNMSPENEKLRRRAIGIVQQAAEIDAAAAVAALEQAGGSIKTAIVASVARISAGEARSRLEAAAGNVRVALERDVSIQGDIGSSRSAPR